MGWPNSVDGQLLKTRFEKVCTDKIALLKVKQKLLEKKRIRLLGAKNELREAHKKREEKINEEIQKLFEKLKEIGEEIAEFTKNAQ